jgi:hypothetical protein
VQFFIFGPVADQMRTRLLATMDLESSQSTQSKRDQRRNGFACLLLGGLSLLAGSYYAAPFLFGRVWQPSRDSYLITAILCGLTLLVGHGGRRSIAGPILPRSGARIAGLACAYFTLAAMLLYALVTGALFAPSFEYMRSHN